MAAPENMEANKKSMATPENVETARKRMATPENVEAARERMATPANLEASRKRKATPAYIEATKKKRRERIQSYKAWCKPNTMVDVQKLDLPVMNCVCSACGAQMFPFEFHRKKKDGTITFNLCCGYGR